MHLAGSNDEIFGRRVLQYQPHTLHIVFGITPIAPRIEVAQIEFILTSLCDGGRCQRYFARYKRFAATLALVIEQNAVHGKHAIRFAVIFRYPKTILFGHAVRTARIERRSLLLWYFLHFAEQFRGRCLIDATLLFHAQNAYRFEQTQRADRIGFGGIFRHIETDFDLTLRCQIVDFVGVNFLNDAHQRTAVGHVAIVQIYSAFLTHIAYPFIQIQMLDAACVER